jgi:CelD/BcsL family acetyltransferase involved in cellulose biosynthesis
MEQVKEIDHLEDLADYRACWRALLEETPSAGFFQSLEWLEAYWRHYGAGQKLRVLIVGCPDRPSGILPLVVRTEWTKVGRIRMLTYPLHDWGSYYGPIGPDPQSTLAAGLRHIGETRRNWDTVDLRWVGASGTDPADTQHAMRDTGFQSYKTIWNVTATIDFDGTWEEYLAARPRKWRNNYRRWKRRINQQGEVTHVRYRPLGSSAGDDDPRWDLYDACENIARRSWQGTSRDGTTLSHASVRSFLRDAHAAAVRVGGLDLNLLLLDGRPAAFAYHYYYRGSLYGLRVAYDSSLSQFGAGNLLYTYVIEDSLRRGDHFYDLGVGSLEIKRYLMTHMCPIYRFTHFHPTVARAQLLRIKRWAEARALAKSETATFSSTVCSSTA